MPYVYWHAVVVKNNIVNQGFSLTHQLHIILWAYDWFHKYQQVRNWAVKCAVMWAWIQLPNKCIKTWTRWPRNSTPPLTLFHNIQHCLNVAVNPPMQIVPICNPPALERQMHRTALGKYERKWAQLSTNVCGHLRSWPLQITERKWAQLFALVRLNYSMNTYAPLKTRH